MMMHYTFNGMGGGWMMAIWWILLVFFLLTLVGWTTSFWKSQRDGSSSSALKILEERYAKGEISKGEFESKRNDLLNS